MKVRSIVLRQKARWAVIWSALDMSARHGLQFAISIALARLLLPEDFGTIALLSLFMGIASVFVGAGLSSALIQKQDTTHTDESTVFWFNIGAALVMTLALIGIAPWIADFFSLPVLLPLTMLMACNVFISAAGSVHGTLMSKRLDFKTPMKVGVISTIVSGGIGVGLAWAGHGVWALAAQAVSAAVMRSSLLWIYSTWRPRFVFSRASFSRLFGFGGWLFSAWMLDTIYERAHTLLIGKLYGTHELGVYNRADHTQQLPASVLSGVLSRVAFPLLSSVNQDVGRLRRAVRASVRVMMLVIVPTSTGLAVLAEPFIAVVFGKQWLPAAPILQVLCLAGVLYPMHVINLNVLQAQGHAGLFFRLELVKKAIGTALLVGGSFFGVMGIAWSRVIQSLISLWINGYFTERHLGYGVTAQLRDCASSFVLSALMAAILVPARQWVGDDSLQGLVLLILAGASFYALANYVFRVEALRDAVAFVRGRL